FLLTIVNAYSTIERPASLRSEHRSPSARNAVRVPFGIRVHLRWNPHKGSHGRLFLGGRFTTLKDLKKEIGPGLLKSMCADLGIQVSEL
ncbi:MAG: hypothetical protein SF187_12145, partial [Deltaproteobacteria bacterium]|nr:hypothetical protein [Deltaproteobacteria bacterium]